MLNRPSSFLSDSNPEQSQSELSVDGNPFVRIGILFALFLIPMTVIVGRLSLLQVVSSDEFATGSKTQFKESFEPIRTTDGRILMGATVLARDVPTYRLKMHYRWLEEDADKLWLRRKAYSRMSKAARRDKKQVREVEQNVLAERQQMWRRLSATLGWTDDELKARRLAVQRRVERIVNLVDARKLNRELALERAVQQARAANSVNDGWWETHWKTVERELTTPPKRPRRDSIVIQEELDYHVIAKKIPFDQIAELVSRPELYPGLDFEMVTRRDYPHGSLLAHVVGSRQPTNQGRKSSLLDDLAIVSVANDNSGANNLPDQNAQRVGQSGLEASYNQQLQGRSGLRRIVRNQSGEIVRSEIVREARAGADIELTVIDALQRKVESWLDELVGPNPNASRVTQASHTIQNERTHVPEPVSSTGRRPPGACILAMNVYTGELLVAACAPRFDLQMLVEFDQQKWDAVNNDPRFPMFSRVTQMALPPGSVFKTLTALAGIQEGYLTSETSVDCIGHLYPNNPNKYRCYRFKHWGSGHGPTNLNDAICRSCNVFFFTAAKEMGPGPIIKWSRRLGFGQPTGIDLPNESSGNLPRPRLVDPIQLSDAEPLESAQHRWREGSTLGLAIGQAELTTTPLQIVRMMALVANGGTLVTPHVVGEVRERGSMTAQPIKGQHKKIEISERTLHLVRQGLEHVVASPRGTGKRIRLKQVTIAGKTGTAEVGGNKTDHAWFAGYTPAERPQVAFVVVIENGGSGGANAGPYAKKLVEALVEHEVIVPTASKDKP
jgi:penicillin-binding protein 2